MADGQGIYPLNGDSAGYVSYLPEGDNYIDSIWVSCSVDRRYKILLRRQCDRDELQLRMSSRLITAIFLSIVSFIGFEIWFYFVRKAPEVHLREPVFESYATAAVKNFADLYRTGPRERLTSEMARGEWTFIFVGYTSCPDVCPATLSVLGQVFRSMDPRVQQDTRAIFVSIDSKNDTQEKAMSYAARFDPHIAGFRQSEAETRRFVNWLGAGFSVDQGSVSHSTSVYLANPAGDVIGEFVNPHSPDEILASFMQVKSANSTSPAFANFLIKGGRGADVFGGYGSLRNDSSQSLTLMSVDCPDFARTEMHEMKMADRQMTMTKLEQIEIGAQTSVEFEPRHKHLMIFRKPAGESELPPLAKCVLHFNGGISVDAYAQVEESK